MSLRESTRTSLSSLVSAVAETGECLLGAIARRSHAQNLNQPSHALKSPDMSNDANCAICYEPLKGAEPSVVTICAHVYHSRCLRAWICQKPWQPSCPLCRTQLREPSTGQSLAGEGNTSVAMIGPHENQTEANEQNEINELTRGLARALDVAEAAPSSGTSALLRAETGMHPRLVSDASTRTAAPRAAHAAARTRYLFPYMSGFAARGASPRRQSHAPEHTITAIPMPGEQLARFLRM